MDLEYVEAEDEEDAGGEGMESDNEEETTSVVKPKEVYLPGKPLEDGEELVCDESAYIMLHQASTGAPCLSFDILSDELGAGREKFPLTAYMVAGTQAARTHVNNLIVMKMSNLHKTQEGGEEEEEEYDAEELEDDQDDDGNAEEKRKPQMRCALIKHQGCVNRIRARRLGNTVYAASWSELGRVNIWDLSKQLQAVEDSQLLKQYEREFVDASVGPAFTFNGHQQEGFAIDWSICAEGVLATGDCK